MRYEEFFLNFAVIMQQKDNSHKSWAQGKKPSMKRRCADNNYTERGLYLITIATEGRQSLLGTLVGKAEATEGPDKPHVVATTTASFFIRTNWPICWLISTTTLVAFC